MAGRVDLQEIVKSIRPARALTSRSRAFGSESFNRPITPSRVSLPFRKTTCKETMKHACPTLALLGSGLSLLLLSAAAEPVVAIACRGRKKSVTGGGRRDGQLNPPPLVWLHEPAQRYTVQWAQRKELQRCGDGHQSPFNTIRITRAAPGAYHWRYRFTTAGGVASTECQPFGDGSSGSGGVSMPSRVQQRARVPGRPSPALLAPRRTAALARTGPGQRRTGSQLRADADRIISAGPTQEPEHLGSARDKNNKGIDQVLVA